MRAKRVIVVRYKQVLVSFSGDTGIIGPTEQLWITFCLLANI